MSNLSDQTRVDAISGEERGGDSHSPLIDVRDLRVEIHRDDTRVTPLHGVSMSIATGQSVGVVGESGCGKTMTAYSLLRLLPPGGRITAGQLLFRRKRDDREVDLAQMDPKSRAMRAIRGGDISIIFQEPMTAFSPVHTIRDQIGDMIHQHRNLPRRQRDDRVVELLELVGIPHAARRVDDYAFQLSGGMRQRAMVAMALASEPRLLIADEPTTALDVTVQARVLKLIKSMQEKFNLALMLITHDLGVVAHLVDYVYVMYLGQVVEKGPVRSIFHRPAHPYTRALLRSIPDLSGTKETIESIPGNVPAGSTPPSGCHFHPRCPEYLGEVCREREPELLSVGVEHAAACLKHDTEVPQDGDNREA